jgi:hypothetical protein
MIDIKKDVFARLVISAKSMKETELEDNTSSPIQVSVEPPADTIESKIENPKIIEIKKELDTAEEIFSRIKTKEHDKRLLFDIENRLLKLRQLVNEKSYY